MIKRYRTKIVGDGLTMETARKPEFHTEGLNWTLIEDNGSTAIVEIDTEDFSVLEKYVETVEVNDGDTI